VAKFQQADENVEAMTFVEDDRGYFPMIGIRKIRILQHVARAFNGRQRSPHCPDEAYGDLSAPGCVQIMECLATSRLVDFGQPRRGKNALGTRSFLLSKEPGENPDPKEGDNLALL
jgi:hypothetical protein